MKTLVLNASYEVMKIVSWERAICWVFMDKVDIIEEYEELIHSPSISMKIPAVVKYKKFIKPRSRVLKFSRSNIHIRDNFTCQYCVKQISPQKLTVDHILPRSRGGNSTWLNCVACCKQCNIEKANKTPKEAGMKLVREPYQPNQKEALAFTLKSKSIIIPDVWKNYSLPQ